VLVEGYDNGLTIGRSYRDAPEIDGLVFAEGRAESDKSSPSKLPGNGYDLTGTLVPQLIKI